MESWRSYNNEEPTVLSEGALDALKRIGAVVKGKFRDLESKGAAIKYSQDALKALQNDPAFKIDQAGTEAEKAATIKDRQIQLLKDLIARKKIELGGELGAPEEMQRKAIEQTIKNAEDAIVAIRTGTDKPAAAPTQGQQSAKNSRLGLKFTGEPRIGGTMGTLTPARQDNYQAQDLYVKKSDNRIPDAPGAGAATGDGAGDGDDTGDQKLPIPVFKKFTGKERETIGMPRASAGSLSSQLMKLYPDIDKAIITQILKDIAGQLKTNNIQIQEAKKLFLEKLISEVSHEATTEDKLYDLFVKTIKRLDLHTQAGRKAAMENEQSYLGAFRFFKAMQLANRSLKRGNLKDDYKKIIRKVEPLNEEARYGARYGEESGKGAGKDLKTWLGNMINIFKEDGLADSERGMAAIKAAKKQKFGKPDSGPRTKADIEREREAAKAAGSETSRRTGKSGVVNTRAVVGPRLKQGGVDLDSPEGRKLQKNIEKAIRRFLRKNLKRVGANPNLIAEQKFEDRLVGLLVNYFSKV